MRLLIFALLIAGVATPALAVTKNTNHRHTHAIAQAGTGGWGTGNVQPYQFDPSGRAHQMLTPAPGPGLIPPPNR